MNEKKNEIILFENQGVKLEVNLNDETVWLNRQQLAKLFDRDIKTIGKHINNALNEELKDIPTVAKFATVQKEGERDVTRNIEYYNLDMILSVGYRVKSDKGIIFRRWANKVLKEYTLKGYAVNKKRLEYLEKTIKLIDIANRIDERLEGNDAKEILKVIGDYSKALNLLDDYDHRTLKKTEGNIDERKIEYKECIEVINKLRFKEESSLFAVERDKGLKSIIGNIYQSFDGQDIYKSIEEKSANFLYLIVKNHVFTDGNKRIAATLFIYFLNFYGILYKDGKQTIDNNTLAALTLLIMIKIRFKIFNKDVEVVEMLDLKKIQKEIYQNKVDKGFNVTDINKEFCLTYGEIAEAYEAWRKKKDDLGEELADVAIYLLGLSEILGIDLEDEIQKKVYKNSKREYKVIDGINTRVKEFEDDSER